MIGKPGGLGRAVVAKAGPGFFSGVVMEKRVGPGRLEKRARGRAGPGKGEDGDDRLAPALVERREIGRAEPARDVIEPAAAGGQAAPVTRLARRPVEQPPVDRERGRGRTLVGRDQRIKKGRERAERRVA